MQKEFYKLCRDYDYIPTIFPAVSRIVVLGDIHGDFALAKSLLIFSKVATFNNDIPLWIGGNSYVIQVGDQIDRCRPFDKDCTNPTATFEDENSDIKVLQLFNNLHRQAISYGGCVISLLGNHEIMNVLGDMRYVSHEGTIKFKNNKQIGLDARIKAFKPGNKYGKMLGCTRLPAVIIGSNLFVHGGIIDNIIDKLNIKDRNGLIAFNIMIRNWLLGLIKDNDIKKYISDESPFWTRLLGKIPSKKNFDDADCYNNLVKTMKLLQIDNIIIGHTPQNNEEGELINSTCGNKVWRVDTALSRAFEPFHKHSGKKRPPIQYLEILNDKEFNVRTFMDNI